MPRRPGRPKPQEPPALQQQRKAAVQHDRRSGLKGEIAELPLCSPGTAASDHTPGARHQAEEAPERRAPRRCRLCSPAGPPHEVGAISSSQPQPAPAVNVPSSSLVSKGSQS
ncbi:hypothetical protein NDU88_004639 [Pleurodeles waltl]|uniref:Uncharacterized protein n=1 Tax=Pleurodeles waltl TaxID=8319 RepID=A0AAV7KYZ3_PLEWA|nr:hypothetical protein NDU88_004639 [Pleurodeles waltl]